MGAVERDVAPLECNGWFPLAIVWPGGECTNFALSNVQLNLPLLTPLESLI